MCRKFLSIISLFILCSSLPVLGDVFNDWVDHSENITIDGLHYRADTTDDILILREINGTDRVVLEINSSEMHKNYFFRSIDSKNSLSEYLKEHNITGVRTSEETYLHHLVVTEVSHMIDVNRQFTPSEPYVFEGFNVTYTVENKGDQFLSGIEYIERVPSFLRAESFINLDSEDKDEISVLRNGDIRWRFSLAGGESRNLKGVYNIVGIPRDGRPFSLNSADLVHPVQGGTEKMYIEEEDVFVDFPLEMKLAQNYNNLQRNEEIDFSFEITNNHRSREIDINGFDLVFPSSVKVNEIPDDFSNEGNNRFSLDIRNLEPEETKGFTFTIIPRAYTYSTVETFVDYTISSYRASSQFRHNLTTRFESPSFKLDFEPLGTSNLRGGDLALLGFSVENKDDSYIENLSIRVNSDFFSQRNYVYRTVKEGRLIEGNFTVQIPSFSEESTREIIIISEIDSFTGDVLNYNHTIDVDILPGLSEEIIGLSASVSNWTNSSYVIDFHLTKLADSELENITFEIGGDAREQSVTVPEDFISQLGRSGSTANLPLNITFEEKSINDLGLNKTQNKSVNETEPTYELIIYSEILTEGRLKSFNETFFVSGYNITRELDLSENLVDLFEEKEEEEMYKSNVTGISEGFRIGNLAFIIYGSLFVIVFVILAIFFMRKRKKRRPKVEYDDLEIEEGAVFDELIEDDYNSTTEWRKGKN